MGSVGALRDPLANRGTAFSLDERERLGIGGRLPPRVETIDEQVVRVPASVRAKAAPIDK